VITYTESIIHFTRNTTVMATIKNAVGYCRVSTGEQVIENQIDKLREAGITVIFADKGISGSIPAKERPDYKEMMKYLDSNPDIKTIVVFEISRLGRQFQDSVNTFLDLEKRGVMVYSLTEGWTQVQDPVMRPLLVAIMSWVNDQALTSLKHRIKAGIEHAKKYGTKSGIPIGKPSKNIDRTTVETLRASGMSWHKIADNIGCEVSTLYRNRKSWDAKDLGRG
jgi:putative DNA-invertase from lambdoid prophage Rac